jgi:hypothetical protein
MTNLETIQQISDTINANAIPYDDGENEKYVISDYTSFYNAITQFESLSIAETDSSYNNYLDLKILIGKILATFKDEPSNKAGVKLINYDNSRNTLTIANDYWSYSDSINYLYLINHANTDFEIYSSGYIIVPLGTE